MSSLKQCNHSTGHDDQHRTRLKWWWSKSTPVYNSRRVFVNLPLPSQLAHPDGTPIQVYPPNTIRTSKYTLLSFIPKNLFEQFRRAANTYFLIMIVMQAVPLFTVASTPWMPALPLIVIVVITGIKDLVEDSRRQASDRTLNKSTSHVLSQQVNTNYAHFKRKLPSFNNKQHPYSTQDKHDESKTWPSDPNWETVTWGQLRVGDIIMLSENESIPADIVILSSSDATGIAYVETKNLDGETNLKTVEAIKETTHLHTAEDFLNTSLVIESELPTLNLYYYSGTMLIIPPDSNPIISVVSSSATPFPLAQPAPIGDIDVPLSTVVDAYPGSCISPINIQNILLRGAVVRNVDHIVGVVISTGSDTKVVMNSGSTPSPRSNIEKSMDIQVVLNFLILVILSTLIIIMEGRRLNRFKHHFGSINYENNTLNSKLVLFGACIIMMQNIVPISLYVSLEVMKSFQSYFIYQDIDMYDTESDSPCIPKSWNITDDLGQIEYLFSDKTGTLTQNKMEFRRCSINGVIYGQELAHSFSETPVTHMLQDHSESLLKGTRKYMDDVYTNPMMSKDASFVDDSLFRDYLNDPIQKQCIIDMFTVLSVCHTVPTPTHHATKMLHYSAQSPDEGALVSGAKDVGFTFLRRELNRLHINILGNDECFILLHVLEFNSTRKRMSVIVRNQKQQIILMTKGADSTICQRLASGQDAMVESVLKHLSCFATEGLRTLCIAQRVLSEAEYSNWLTVQKEASVALSGRDQLLDAAAEMIEKELVLLGATAIEDKLQDGVPQTISILREAGLRIWVLTGDKLETAINIGYSSNLLSEDMTLLVVSGVSSTDVCEQLEYALKHFQSSQHPSRGYLNSKAAFGELPLWLYKWFNPRLAAQRNRWKILDLLEPVQYKKVAMVMDGESLDYVLNDDHQKEIFLKLSVLCKSIICCRVNPKQKARVVQLVQDGLGAICLSVGDGANDVSMIQQAEIGVGISGREGVQAALASDFVIGQFRFLSKLLLIHGHWSYYRIGESILNFFFKNMTWVFALFWYQSASGYTAIILYEYNYILLFNLIFTAAPPLIIGIFDQDLTEAQILAFPQIYHLGMSQYFFNFKRFLLYMSEAIYQSYISYHFAQLSFADIPNTEGLVADRLILGTVTALNAIIAINCTMVMNIRSWTWISAIVMFFSAISFPAYLPFHSMIVRNLPKGIISALFTDPRLYIEVALCTITCLIPRMMILSWKLFVSPSDIDIIRESMNHSLTTRGSRSVRQRPSSKVSVLAAEKANADTLGYVEHPDIQVLRKTSARKHFSESDSDQLFDNDKKRSLELSFSRHVDIFPDEMQKFTEPAVLDEIFAGKEPSTPLSGTATNRSRVKSDRSISFNTNVNCYNDLSIRSRNTCSSADIFDGKSTDSNSPKLHIKSSSSCRISVSRVLPSAATHTTRFSEDISRYDEDGQGHIVFMGGPLPDNTESLDHDPMHANIPALPPADGLGDADVPWTGFAFATDESTTHRRASMSFTATN
ncbi:phospholipid transporting ATPase [Batrachochytrium dendrobatidis]